MGLFALEGEESYGYCKNSDLTRMDCAEVARVYARFLKEEKGCDLVIAISTAAWKRTGPPRGLRKLPGRDPERSRPPRL